MGKKNIIINFKGDNFQFKDGNFQFEMQMLSGTTIGEASRQFSLGWLKSRGVLHPTEGLLDHCLDIVSRLIRPARLNMPVLNYLVNNNVLSTFVLSFNNALSQSLVLQRARRYALEQAQFVEGLRQPLQGYKNSAVLQQKTPENTLPGSVVSQIPKALVGESTSSLFSSSSKAPLLPKEESNSHCNCCCTIL